MEQIPWEQIYQFTLSCGSIHELKAFSLQILTELRRICPYDQALFYFLDGNGKMYDQYLVNMDTRWNQQYLVYYATVADNQYNYSREFRETPQSSLIQLRDWEREPASEFLKDYISPGGVKYSLGIPLFDNYGRPRTIFALDRTHSVPYTREELSFLNLAVPQLNNLHKNFFCSQEAKVMPKRIDREKLVLTRREQEVAQLLCEGVSPENIGKNLCISLSTTNKHIAHIYRKTKVSSRQELLVTLLG
ncbi:MAG: hypothetical protein HFI30_01865 [Lachnospiraceae bacterium]|nr:hypothetical protein [Lachnospiraceae bacterium]